MDSRDRQHGQEHEQPGQATWTGTWTAGTSKMYNFIRGNLEEPTTKTKDNPSKTKQQQTKRLQYVHFLMRNYHFCIVQLPMFILFTVGKKLMSFNKFVYYLEFN